MLLVVVLASVYCAVYRARLDLRREQIKSDIRRLQYWRDTADNHIYSQEGIPSGYSYNLIKLDEEIAALKRSIGEK